MIIYMCIKFQSNTPILSKDIAQKPFVLLTGRTDGTDVRTDSGETICAPLKMAGHKKKWTSYHICHKADFGLGYESVHMGTLKQSNLFQGNERPGTSLGRASLI